MAKFNPHSQSFSTSVPLMTFLAVNFLLHNLLTISASTNDIDLDTPRTRASILTGPISKSPTDKRSYRGLILANHMKVILVSDPNTTKGAASLCIAAGTMNDPEDLPGLAHFTEHMLFLGNEKYPEENEFQKFISEHGGTSNAVTQPDETYYYFTIAPLFLKDALERFAQFFISPLFTESALEREVVAVDSEHQKNIPDDRRRIERVESLTGKLGHPYTQFRTGTKEILWTLPRQNGTDIRDALINFHKNFYSSNLMHLAILGSESLDELQSLVEATFLDVPERNVSLPIWPENPYGPEELKERIDIVPMGDIRSLMVIFPINYVSQYYRTTAVGYVAHLMGQEGSGSLSSVLKGKHWADFVTVGPHVPARGFTFFKVKITLTQEGLVNLNNVTHHIFEYIRMLRESGPQKWFWEEVRDINKLHFQFRDELYPLDLVKRLSVHMIVYPMEHVLHAGGSSPSAQYLPEAINQVLESLMPHNCRLIVATKDFENNTEHVEKYYGVKFSREKIPPELIQEWSKPKSNKEFHLPIPNEFIPLQFSLKPRDENVDQVPRVLRDSNMSKIWYFQDQEFLLPKAVVKVDIFSPVAYMDPVSTNLNYMLAVLIVESLWEFQYNGNLAGLDSEIINTIYGLQLSINGYDHKLGIALHRIFEKIVSFKVDSQHFETVKESRLRLLKNRRDEQPYEHVDDQLRLLLWEKRWSTSELIEVMKGITLDNLRRFTQDFLSKLKFQWLFYGNLTPQEAIQMADDCLSLFISNGTGPLYPSQLMSMRMVELTPGSSYISKYSHLSHSSSCTAVLFQIGVDHPRSNVMVQLLSRIAHYHCYDQLRTKEQLGYTAWADMYQDKDYGTHYFRVLVQGNPHPKYVESRIDNFLRTFGEMLQNMTQLEFTRHKSSLYNMKSNKPKTMEDKAGLIYREIRSEHLNFNRQQIELNALELITLENIREFFNDKVSNPESRRRLVIHVVGMTPGNYGQNFSVTSSEEIMDPITWKLKRGLYPSISSNNYSSYEGEVLKSV